MIARLKLKYHHLTGIEKMVSILVRNVRGGIETVGKRLKTSALSRMRRDTGAAERNLTSEVSGNGLNVSVTVFSTLIQAFIDAYGLPPGTFAPFGPGSRLFNWTQRRMKLGGLKPNKIERISSHVKSRSPVKNRRYIRSIKKSSFRNAKFVEQKGRKHRTPTTARKKAKENSVKRMAFLVSRAIFEKGIKASHWNKEALDANRQRIVTELRNAISRAVNEINRT